jgi:toxin ParE1/3/4
VKLRYTSKAAAELDRILAYIDEQSPQGARRVQRRIQTITELLVQQPYSGRRTSNRRLRRISATPYPYVIFYEITDQEVVIIGVRHGARDPKSIPRRP